jgi:NhaA family Na+:H+ antiporter
MIVLFERFVRSEQAGSVLLVLCTVAALVLANSAAGLDWLAFWHRSFAGLSLEHWVNDALMAVFFLLIGLELKRELFEGELSTRDTALLPVAAAIGGMLAPAAIHFALNAGTPAARGFGIPMATDIAFTLGILALLGRRVPLALRAFIVAFAVIDDLGAIIVIAVFYSDDLSLPFLAGALGLWGVLFAMNRLAGVRALTPFLLLGALLWFLVLKSGVHATLAGVMLAFAVPFRVGPGENSPSERLEHALSRPVAFLILPLFALANAGVMIDVADLAGLLEPNGLGIMAGLVLGKPVGIFLACVLAPGLLNLQLPPGLTWRHLLGAGMLGGIGFTMSIFIANLAFGGQAELINASKLAIFTASLASAILGGTWLMSSARRV